MSSVQVLWVTLASFGQLGLISDPQISSNPEMESIYTFETKNTSKERNGTLGVL